MAERPILFSGPLLRAILDGRKTETRRLVTKGTSATYGHSSKRKPYPIGELYRVGADVLWSTTSQTYVSPRVEAGDLLWVRETFNVIPASLAEPDISMTTGKNAEVVYRSTAGDPDPDVWEGWKWRPSIFMPRWASRISLRVVDVRAERLQEIDDDGAQAEGVHPIATFSRGDDLVAAVNGINEGMAGPPPQPHRDAFKGLWDKINGKREGATWASNPWVWVLKFEVAEVRR